MELGVAPCEGPRHHCQLEGGGLHFGAECGVDEGVADELPVWWHVRPFGVWLEVVPMRRLERCPEDGMKADAFT